MSACPVCQEQIHNDDAFLQAHVNSHFDGDVPVKPRPSGVDKAERAASPLAFEPSREAACPICEYPLLELSSDQAQTHVIACLGELVDLHRCWC